MRRVSFFAVSFLVFLLFPTFVSAETDVSVHVSAEGGSSAGVSVETSTQSSSRSRAFISQRVTVDGDEVTVSKRREERMEKVENRREELKEKREEFKERLSEIKDERKVEIIERIASALSNVNDRWTSNMLRKLERLETILGKIQSRAESLEEEGYDVAEVYTAIEAANDEIASAKASVEAQSEKEYIIEITDEDELRDAVQEMTSQLRSDLSAVKDEVKAAGESVREALKTLKEVVADGE